MKMGEQQAEGHRLLAQLMATALLRGEDDAARFWAAKWKLFEGRNYRERWLVLKQLAEAAGESP